MPEPLTSPTSRKGNSVPTITCRHSLDTISGYVVRRTFPLTGAEHEDVQTFVGAGTYADAVELARELRKVEGTYGLVDPVYECGCRGQA